jgi:peroxisomal enoyl-CoA hydratase 2
MTRFCCLESPVARYNPSAVLPDDEPGPWGETVPISYTERDVLLYAVGIGCTDLRHVYEQHPQFAVFPSFAIRWGGAGLNLDPAALPPSPGPLSIDAERSLELLAPLPRSGTVQVRSRLVAVHPRGKGSAFQEFESEVVDAAGQTCVRICTGVFRRGVDALGDIEPFEGCGLTRSTRIAVPERAPDIETGARIAANQAQIYRLSGDYNPLHIDPEAARFGGFAAPILHGLCTLGHCAQLLLGALCGGEVARLGSFKLRFSAPVYPGDELRVRAWRDGAQRVVFDARVGDRTVVSDAYFAWR